MATTHKDARCVYNLCPLQKGWAPRYAKDSALATLVPPSPPQHTHTISLSLSLTHTHREALLPLPVRVDVAVWEDRQAHRRDHVPLVLPTLIER